jgi:formate dehydrogenase subunit beta
VQKNVGLPLREGESNRLNAICTGGYVVTNTILNVNDRGISDTIKNLLKDMLQKKLLHAVILPLEIRKNISVTLVSDPEMLKDAQPLAPVMPVTTARLVSRITKMSSPSSEKKIGVVLRSCELRALIDLVKLKQASLDNLVIIGADCYGTYPDRTYQDMCKNSAPSFEDIQKTDISSFREACQICSYPAAINPDINIGLFGLEGAKAVLIQGLSAQGSEMVSALGLGVAADTDVKKREEALSGILKSREGKKQDRFAAYQAELKGLDNLQGVFSACINCHNCRVACPMCHCRECFFDSPTFEWRAENYLGWAEKRGALPMPNDRMLFHIGRMNHMVSSCVGCGLCEDACPVGIPVFRAFRLTGDKVQASFEYVAGRSLEEPLPVSDFREDELQDIGN